MQERTTSTEHTRLIVGLGFLSVFSLMLLIAWLSMATLQSVNTDMSTLVRDTTAKTTRAYQMRDAIRLRTASVRSLEAVADADARERVSEHLIEQTARYNQARSELAAFGAKPRERAILEQTEVIDERVSAAYDRVNEVVYAMHPQPEQLRSALGELRLQELVLLNQLGELVELERTLAEESLAASQRTFVDTRRLLLLIVAAAFGLSLAISLLVIARVARANRRIVHLASHDDLTGLHNRRSFEEQLSRVVAVAQRGGHAHGLLYIDLDRFKIVNDTCGHHAGDELLTQLTHAISERLRRGDLFARVGGDEFAIIAHAKTFDAICLLAEDLRALVEEFVFEYSGQSFKVSLSIGVVPIDENTDSIESLLATVDSACYVAKQSGRNRVHVANDNDKEVVKYRNGIAGVRNIRQALAEERLTLFFQPVYDIEDDGVSIAHCEILLRIRSESGELYSPARFIPIAEKYNIMSEIDRWVFGSVANWLAEHQGRYRVPRLLINLSGLSFVDHSFCNYVVARLKHGDIDPTHIAFEIAETAAIDNQETARLFVDRVRALGCKFALDDFGSGFSTFSYLKNMPIDYLKIDGSLVSNLANDPINREMVSAINHIGHSVGAKTVAEYVEDDATLVILREMGVDYAQGYGLRLPSPMARLVDELELLDDSDEPDDYRLAS